MTDKQHEYCDDCVHAEWDYIESYDRHRQYFLDGCRKDLDPVWREDEECLECEGKKVERWDR